jgi:predicted DNA-binding protein
MAHEFAITRKEATETVSYVLTVAQAREIARIAKATGRKKSDIAREVIARGLDTLKAA